MNDPPEVILFDLGGVLVRWDGVSPLLRLSRRELTAEDARRFWLVSPWVRQFERGRCTTEEFAVGVVQELDLALSPDEFLAEFVEWDLGPFPETAELLESLRPRYRLACLSNNNELHWGRLRDRHGLGERFDRCYISHEIGHVKPDPGAFRHVCADLGCPPGRILFLDDNPECVEAARGGGLRAYQARGVVEVRDLLIDLGLLPDEASC